MDLDLDKIASDDLQVTSKERIETLSKSLTPSSELNQFSNYVKKEQSVFKDLTKAFEVLNPLKETQESIQKIFSERQYTIPEFPKLKTNNITDLIIKESIKHPLPTFEDRDKHWKEEILSKFDKLLQDKSSIEVTHKYVVTYTTKDANLTIDGKSIHIKGKNQRELLRSCIKIKTKNTSDYLMMYQLRFKLLNKLIIHSILQLNTY